MTARAPRKPAASPSPETEGAASSAEASRIEVYEAVRPDGERLKVTRNLDTGEATYEAL